jgi:hypothetical protein
VDEFDDLLSDSLDFDGIGGAGKNGGSGALSPIKANNNANSSHNNSMINNNYSTYQSEIKSKKLEDLFGIESKNIKNQSNNVSLIDDRNKSRPIVVGGGGGISH